MDGNDSSRGRQALDVLWITRPCAVGFCVAGEAFVTSAFCCLVQVPYCLASDLGHDWHRLVYSGFGADI